MSAPQSSGSHLVERQAYQQAAAWLRSTVAEVDGRWDEPGLGEWTVRDLVGHASRSLVTVETYLDAEPGEVTLGSAVAYYETIRTATPGDVTGRGRAAGAAMGEDPATFLAELDGRTQAKVALAADEAFVGTPFGGITLVDYLPTRTFELVVHTGDLARALGVTAPEPPETAVASALRLATELVVRQGAGVEVLLALTGRGPLPAGFSLV